MTRAQVARSVGWHRTTLSNIEICERRADILVLYQLATVYGLRLLDLEALLDGEGDADARRAQQH